MCNGVRDPPVPSSGLADAGPGFSFRRRCTDLVSPGWMAWMSVTATAPSLPSLAALFAFIFPALARSWPVWSGHRADVSHLGWLAGGSDAGGRAGFGVAAELAVVKVGVQAAAGEQLGVGALPREPALIEDEDLVGGQDGGQPVGDDDR